MQVNDFLLCTFDGDNTNPPALYVAEITSVDAGNAVFDCRLPDSGQQFTFNYNVEPWAGEDLSGQSYVLSAHTIYTGGKVDPYLNGAAQITFADGKRYLCYVNALSPSLTVAFYQFPYPEISIEAGRVIRSNWTDYPVGSQIVAMEGCVEVKDPAAAPSSSLDGQDTGPFLFVDLYQGDLQGKPSWDILADAPHFLGAIIKATEGVNYKADWFIKNWGTLKEAGQDRYGKTWFRGAYHFLKFMKDGAAQADYYLQTIEKAGGWDIGDIVPVVDVELGNDGSTNPARRNSNQDASAQQIIDCTTAFAEKIKTSTGSQVMLYGRGAMRDKGIANSRMSCDMVWNPSYTETMVMNGLQAWTLDDIVLWQYCGDGLAKVNKPDLPSSIPGFGKVDISVYIDGNRKPDLSTLVSRLGIGSIHAKTS